MTFFLAILTLLLLLTSSYGFGFATMKWVIRDEVNYFSLLVVVGISCLIVLGGILNLARIAYPAALYTVLLLGLIFSMQSFISRLKIRPQLSSFFRSDDSAAKLSLLDRLLPPLIVATAAIFFVATLLPSNAFNHSDDFQGYFIRPLRMLQTGTLGGDPYDSLGLDSLGAQFFLDGFFLLKLPIEYVSGFDAVFCLGVSGMLLIATARKFNLSWIYVTPAILTFLVINPQSVNVSALYSGVFIILGLLLACCLLTERISESGAAKPMGMAVLVGLLISSLVVLKTTLAFFAAIYAAFFFLGLFAIAPNKRRALLISTTAGLTAVIATLPWLLLYLPNYMAAFKDHSHVATETTESLFSLYSSNVSALFSSKDLVYGGSTLGYGVVILLLAILGIFSVVALLRSKGHIQLRGYSLVSASVCAAAITACFLNGSLFFSEVAIRYSCPILIATLPFAMLAASLGATANMAPAQPGSLAQTPLKMAILAGASLVFVLFGSNFYNRIERAYNQHTTVSFSIDDDYIQYNLYVLSGKARQTIHDVQYQTQAGTKILTWISMPLHLDFSRNEIQTMMDSGLVNPWLALPLNGNSVDMVRYLKKQGVRYILWEYHGGGMRNPNEYRMMLTSPYPAYREIGEHSIYMRDMLTAIMKGGSYLYNQNGLVLFDLNQIN